MRKGCHGHSIRGSGYVKPESGDGKKMSEDLQKLLEARTSQDARYFPTAAVTPNLSPSDSSKRASDGALISRTS